MYTFILTHIYWTWISCVNYLKYQQSQILKKLWIMNVIAS